MNHESHPLSIPPAYPAELEHDWQFPGGPSLLIRPLRPDDLERELRFIRGLSQQTLYQRVQYSVSCRASICDPHRRGNSRSVGRGNR